MLKCLDNMAYFQVILRGDKEICTSKAAMPAIRTSVLERLSSLLMLPNWCSDKQGKISIHVKSSFVWTLISIN